MAFEPGDVKIFNPQKEVSKEVILETIIRHRDAFKQARTGEKIGVDMNKITDNDRRLNQVQALSLIISAQREMITISRPIIVHNSTKRWQKANPTEEKREKTPFESYNCDYNKLMNWLSFLKECQEAIAYADKTKDISDDFLKTYIDKEGNQIFELTDNFRDMLDDLEESYEKIYLLMILNKIVSSGLEDDEELTEKELEQEAIRRIAEA